MIDKIPSVLTGFPQFQPVSPPKRAEATETLPQEVFTASGLPAPSLPTAPPPLPTPPLEAAPSPNLPVLETLLSQQAADPENFLLADSTRNTVQLYRDQARQLRPDASLQQQEVTALTLLERDLSHVPRTLTVDAPPPPPQMGMAFGPAAFSSMAAPPVPTQNVAPARLELAGKIGGMANCAAYTGFLASTLATGAVTLTPGLLQVLGEFQPSSVFESNASGWRNNGSFEQYGKTLGSISQTTLTDGAELRGAWSDREVQMTERFMGRMKERLPGSEKLVHTILMGTYLSGHVDDKGVEDFSVDGLSHGQGQISLHRPSLDGGEARYAGVIYHEVGHEKDRVLSQQGGFRSEEPGSPFGQTRVRSDFISDYAMTNRREDFAETHRELLENWEPIMANPDLHLYARGALGDKRRFILESYDQPVPPPSAALEKAWRDVDSGQSPFGWKREDGSMLDARRDFETTVQQFLPVYEGCGGKFSFPLTDKMGWILENVLGQKAPEPANPGGVPSIRPVIGIALKQDVKELRQTAEGTLSALNRFDELGQEAVELFQSGRDASPEVEKTSVLYRLALLNREGKGQSEDARQLGERMKELGGLGGAYGGGLSGGYGGGAIGGAYGPLPSSPRLVSFLQAQSDFSSRFFAIGSALNQTSPETRAYLLEQMPAGYLSNPVCKQGLAMFGIVLPEPPSAS